MMVSMSKKILRKYVKDTTGITIDESKIVVNVVIDGIKKQLLDNGKVIVQNFGTFYVKRVKERVARNPKTGQTVLVPTKNVVRFKPANKLKDLVKGISGDGVIR